MTSCTCDHCPHGSDDAFVNYLASKCVQGIYDMDTCQGCVYDYVNQTIGGDDEMGVFLVDKLLEDIYDEDDLDSRSTAMALLCTLLLDEENGPPLSSAASGTLNSLNTVKSLAKALSFRYLPKKDISRGILCVMKIATTKERTQCFLEGVGGFYSLYHFMDYHEADAYNSGLMFNLLCRIAGQCTSNEIEVARQHIDDETDFYTWKDLADNMVRVMEMHLTRCPCTFHLYLLYLPEGWRVLRFFYPRVKTCIFVSMAVHSDDEHCRRVGEEVLAEISDPLEDCLYAMLQQASGESSCSAAA
jgi:hypothetical protein